MAVQRGARFARIDPLASFRGIRSGPAEGAVEGAAVVTAAYAATVRAEAAVVTTLNPEIAAMEEQVEAHFGQHPDAEVYLSQPGLGPTLAARVLGEFGDDPERYADARSRKNYAGTSPITRASGRKKAVLARYVRNRRLADALHQQAFSALTASGTIPSPV